jgi:hypothetical protein
LLFVFGLSFYFLVDFYFLIEINFDVSFLLHKDYSGSLDEKSGFTPRFKIFEPKFSISRHTFEDVMVLFLFSY